MNMKEKMLAGVLAGAFIFSVSAGSPAAFAEEQKPPPKAEQPRMSKAEIDALAKDIAQQYGVNQTEVRTALGEDRLMDDIYYAAMLAKISGKSFANVLSMKADWFDVMKKLNITPEQWKNVLRDMTAEDIASRSYLDKETVKKLMDEHYSPRDIRTAGRLAHAAKKDVRSVLNMKRINQHWFDVAKELKVDPKVVRPRTPAEEEEDKEAPAKAENEQ